MCGCQRRFFSDRRLNQSARLAECVGGRQFAGIGLNGRIDFFTVCDTTQSDGPALAISGRSFNRRGDRGYLCPAIAVTIMGDGAGGGIGSICHAYAALSASTEPMSYVEAINNPR